MCDKEPFASHLECSHVDFRAYTAMEKANSVRLCTVHVQTVVKKILDRRHFFVNYTG